MTAFDPSTSYLEDHELHDFVEDGFYTAPANGDIRHSATGLKVKRFDASDPAAESIAIGLGMTAEDSILLVWMPLDVDGEQPPFEPQVGGTVGITDGDDWVVRNFRKSRFGAYEMGVVKARENVES